ncbi:MAG: Stk1 family PASTA domain-containing Ser/Thr kinase [Erysipelotrichaceae bacterium]|nr:Stk1 family PASTA domain-containing Ser/Thr kinase [Erysipelotrichaceae bacterium]
MAVEYIGKRYIVVKELGEGGMANVYLAIDSILKREVAVKVLRNELASDSINLQRFQREAEAITNMSHPNIVEVYDVGQENGKNYIVMEYVHGPTLRQLIKQRGALNQDEAINIMKQLVSAVSHAHRNGIIHRDIKSQNVMVKDDGTVKLSDFGIAIVKGESDLTQANTVMGTVHYLAPELAKGAAATVQSDIYSLGIVFYEMLTGDVPFRGETAVEIALKHMHETVPSVREFNPLLPQSVENIITRATAQNPAKRYLTAEEMYNDLVTCLDFNRLNEAKLDLTKKKKEEVKKVEEVVPVQVKRKKKGKTDSGSGNGTTLFAVMGALLLAFLIFAVIKILNGGSIVPPEKVRIPDVTGYVLEDARELIEQTGLTIESIKYEVTDDKPKDTVLYSSPAANIEVEKGTTITLVVSSGMNFTVENYNGKNIDDVRPVLEAAGIKVFIDYEANSKVKPGTITAQSLPVGTIISPEDSNRSIKFTVADVVTFQIPFDIEGMDVDEAKKLLTGLGAKVETKKADAGDTTVTEEMNRTVAYATPSIGSSYTQTEDSVITLYYYVYVAPAPPEDTDTGNESTDN